MSRVALIEQLYAKRKSALEFNYDALWAPPIRSILTQEDIDKLYKIASSLKYNGNIDKKYEMIDAIMKRRGFKKAHAGTNRVVYNYLELPTFVAKIAIDRVGLEDSPAEFKNQEFFKPFCCKIFEVDPTGVIAFVERVNPITSLEEFLSVSDDIFNLMITKIIGKYVIDDLGTEKFMNYGVRCNSNGYTFGPVIIDFPYAFELDGGKMICTKQIDTPYGKVQCGGEIDYDSGLNHLICTKCNTIYLAQDLKKDNPTIKIVFDSDNFEGDNVKMRVKIINSKTGEIIHDSGRESRTYITKEEYTGYTPGVYTTEVAGNIRDRHINPRKYAYKYGKVEQEKNSKLVDEHNPYLNTSYATKVIVANPEDKNKKQDASNEEVTTDTSVPVIDTSDQFIPLPDESVVMIPEFNNSGNNDNNSNIYYDDDDYRKHGNKGKNHRNKKNNKYKNNKNSFYDPNKGMSKF